MCYNRSVDTKDSAMVMTKGMVGHTHVVFEFGDYDGNFRLTSRSIDDLFNNYCERTGLRTERVHEEIINKCLPHTQSITNQDYEIYDRTKLLFSMSQRSLSSWRDRINKCYTEAYRSITQS